MTSERLIYFGQACFGRSWQAQLADRLGVDRRTVGNWIRDNPPRWLEPELMRVVEVRYFELKKAYEESKNENRQKDNG